MSAKRKRDEPEASERHKKARLVDGRSVSKYLSALDVFVLDADCDNLVAFLEKEPQTDMALRCVIVEHIGTYSKTSGIDEIFALLLSKIGDPSGFDASKCLFHAAYNGYTSTARLIIETFPFDINYLDDFHGSALCAAVRMDSTEIALELLEQPGIDINIMNTNKRSAVWMAACNKNKVLLDKLVAMGAVTLEPDAEDTLPEQRTTTELATTIRNNQDFDIGSLTFK